MPTIQDTISRAIMIIGTPILKDKEYLCVILEDLSPELSEELEFIRKIYNDEVGKFFYEAIIEDKNEIKSTLLKDADRYLDLENGRNPIWREKLISFFRNPIMKDSCIKDEDIRRQDSSSDEEKIIKWQEDAIKEMELGEFYEKKGDMINAFKHYYNAATLGNAKGAFFVGYMYEYGEGVKKNLEYAAEWYLKAAHAGNRGAQHNIACFYYTGTVVNQDYKMAYEYFNAAAIQGKADSMLNIGVMYEHGEYVNKDIKKALEFYMRAADNGDENGRKYYYALMKKSSK